MTARKRPAICYGSPSRWLARAANLTLKAALLPRPKPRRRLPWAAYLWPGLPHLWIRGSLAGLTLALAFSVLLNVLVLATLVWPAWLESRLKFACAITALGLWIAALWETRGELRRLAIERESRESSDENPVLAITQGNDELLIKAQACYLQGNLPEAERSLRTAIRLDRDDFEARFWLVSVLRCSGRLDQAERMLRRVERLDAARTWRHEINDERQRLTELLHPIRESAEPVILPIDPTGNELPVEDQESTKRHAA